MFGNYMCVVRFIQFSVLLIGVIFSSHSHSMGEEIPEVDYPRLATRATSAKDFVPKGWKLEHEKQGDLNADGIDDLLLILHQDDPNNVLPRHEGDDSDKWDTNPRILAVAFASKSSAEYTLAQENHTLSPRIDSPYLDDPLDEGAVSIVRGTVRISLRMWMSAGSWGAGTMTYIFRYQEGCFRLIGYDREEFNRGTGKTLHTSINYLTGKVKLGRGNIDSSNVETNWKRLPKQKKLCMDEVGDGFRFSPVLAD